MKPFHAIAVMIAVLVSSAAYAEYVFKKDGGIVKGNIIRDEAKSIEVRTAEGGMERINREDILRIVYTELYLGKVFARLTSGEVVEGYQVYENRDFFFFRKELSKPEEQQLPRNKVLFIVRTNPTDLSAAAATQSAVVKWSPPFRPAKYYRVFVRDAKANAGNFTMAGETRDVSLALKDLKKSWSYEVYATAINDAGEESLPSEKIMLKTRPEAPEKLAIREERALDGKTATLIFSWRPVSDAASRVSSYGIYSIKNNERKLVGTAPATAGEFRLEGVPAVGKHRFAVVAVNDDKTESADLPGIWDAGLKPVFRLTAGYVSPLGDMTALATAGYGIALYGGLAARYFDAGLELGFISYTCASEVDTMMAFPLYAAVSAPYTLWGPLAVRPTFKAGVSFDYIAYRVHDPLDPLRKKTKSEWTTDPAMGAALYVEWMPSELLRVYAGIEYTVIAQSTMMQAIGYAAGVGVQF
jgi:hypothetical protein